MSAEGRTVIIGRAQGSDIVLSHPSVSRRHAELTVSADGRIEIRDLGSKGGTLVQRSGKEFAVTREQLQRADVLRLGDYEISVADLLAMVGETESTESDSKPAPGTTPTRSESPPKSRLMRCDCGSIKERGSPCPNCGA